MSKTYYIDQLNKIATNCGYAPTVQIVDAGGKRTKNLNLNKESAEVLINWLKVNFVNTVGGIKIPPAKTYALSIGTYNTSDYVLYTRKTKKGFINLIKAFGFNGPEVYSGQTFNSPNGKTCIIKLVDFPM